MEKCTQSEDKQVFKYHGKKYELVDELVKGGCQGCAFINRIDCTKLGKTDYCRNGKIFMLYLKD